MNILNVEIDNLTFGEILKKAEEFLQNENQRRIATINAEFIVDAQKDIIFREIINSSDLKLCDGAGPFFFSSFFGEKIKERIAGVELVSQLVKLAKEKNKKVFFFGGLPKAAEISLEKLQKIYGFFEGAFEENLNLAEIKIKSFKPDILFVALGHPKQEKWIFKNLKKFPYVKIAMGVGGSFEMIAGFLPRAPVWMQKFGLEWLWRLWLQPKRIKRIFKAMIIFPSLIFKNKIKLKK